LFIPSTLAVFFGTSSSLMDIITRDIFLKDLIIILFSVKVLGRISKKLGLPSLFGKLLVGIILGPSMLGILHPSFILKKLAEIGVILLMFLAGLETNINYLKKTFLASTLTALGGVILPLLGGVGCALIWDYELNTALFIGVILVATSVSISVETLRETGKLQTFEGYTILGAAVIDDILGLFALSTILGFISGNGQIMVFNILILKIIIFFIIVIFTGNLIIPIVLSFVFKDLTYEGKLTFALIIAFAFALIAEYFGLAGIVGAYLAGIIISQTRAGNQNLFEKVEVIGHSFFFPVFFASIGVTADLSSLNGNLLVFTVIATLLAIITKILGASSGAKLSGLNFKNSLVIGAGMVPRGEVALIIANIGMESRLLTVDLYTSMIVLTIVTAVVTPLLIRMFLYE